MKDRGDKQCCCNCKHCLRIKGFDDVIDYNECEIDGHYIGYIETFEGWCRHWSKERKWGE